ncbi:MAG TPA: high frequency lysogenization protein HflD [Candidatus Competibacteraceae bacterium]|nr:high frequency lysogenization protein HflD [Candidatus Competibacteraceae bacterium]
MPQTDQDRVIALAGLFQAARLVQRIAREGQATPAADFAACLHSLFQIDAPSSAAVYGGLEHLRSGLEQAVEQLRQPRNMEITRYTVALLVLERKLARRPDLLARLGDGIRALRDRLAHFPLTHDNIVAGLAELYVSTISTLSPRIMVNGDARHLNQPQNAERIRALLLAGIRAAILWRQSGGSRLTLLLRRRALLTEAQHLLAGLPPVSEPPAP